MSHSDFRRKKIHDHASILFAEAIAYREGVKQAIGLGIQNIHIKGDNLVVINSIRQIRKISWDIHSLIQDTAIGIEKFHHTQITHIYRESNKSADYLANLGHAKNKMTIWHRPCDLTISLIIQKDALGWSYVNN